MVNGLTACQVLLGCWLLGAVAVPMNSRYKSAELRHVIDHAQLRCLFINDSVKDHVDHPERLESAFPDLSQAARPEALSLELAPALRSVVYLGETARAGFLGEPAFREMARRGGAVVETDPIAMSDPALMIYTSGTTAHPKGCLHTHATIARQSFETGQVMGLVADDRLWDPLPVCHVGGILPMVAAFQAGASYHTVAHFEPAQALCHLEREAATLGYIAFPTLINSLIEHPDYASTDLSALRWLLAIGPPAFLRRVQLAFPDCFQAAGYGATELGGVITYSRIGDPAEARATTCGTPLPGIELRISDPIGGGLVPPQVVGEIEMRGHSRIHGYYLDEGELQVSEDEWLKTGDLGSLTPEGEIVFAGRLKDMLKIGGENVAAAEIEAFLATHPAVAVAQVVGVPDQRLDEVAAAFVELVPNASVTETELLAFCEGNIAGFKVPRFFRFVDEWPMSATKVQKFRLREALLGEVGSLV
jgi:acyl-CoA synthetase (AMP-forming)/AMP-acid ligase II